MSASSYVRIGSGKRPPLKKEPSTSARFHLRFRDGRRISYPFALLGSINLVGNTALILHCQCHTFKRIEFNGSGLQHVFEALSQHFGVTVMEDNHGDFTGIPSDPNSDETIFHVSHIQLVEKAPPTL